MNAAVPSDPTAHARPRVLVVDDEADTRELVRIMLAKECEVVDADSGERAWEMLVADASVQMVITDLRMSGLDGCDLIGRVRGADDTRLRELPVLLITGADDGESRRRAFAYGATAFIVKPIDVHQLRALVNMHLRQARIAGAARSRSDALAAQAPVDPLTHLRSERDFMGRGGQDFAFCLRLKSDLAAICVEIENFRNLVTLHGQHTADQLLVWLAELLLAHTPAEDTVARLGEMQFGVLATATDLREALALCERVRHAATVKPFVQSKNNIPVTLKFGVATLMQDKAKTLDALLKQARERLVPSSLRAVESAVVPDAIEVASVPVPESLDMPAIEDTLPDTPASSAPTGERDAQALSVDVPETTSDLAPEETPAMHLDIGEAVDQEAPPVEVPVFAPLAVQPSVSAPPMPLELMSVDTAVMLLEQHKEQLLLPYAEYLMQQIQPLLDYQRTRKTGSVPGNVTT